MRDVKQIRIIFTKRRNGEIAKTFTSFTFCPSGLPCFARSRPPASRFTSFRSAVVELTS